MKTVFETTVQLPYGVRQIFTPVGGRKIRDIDELQDGRHYVCGGFELDMRVFVSRV